MARRTKFEVGVTIKGDDRLTPEVKRAQGSFARFGSSIKKNAVAIGVSITGIVVAFRGVTRAITSTIKAAGVQEDAIRALDAALIPLGKNAGAVSKALQEQASALQKVTRFGDETIIKGQALIASFSRNEETIKAATVAAIDLAAATGTNLNSAFLLMGRAAAGETSTLSRYGIILDEGIPKSEKFAAAVKKINDQFGGQAEEQVKTFTGAIDQLGNSFGDLQEKIGEAITKNDEATGGIARLRERIEESTPAVANVASKFVEWLSSITKLTNFGLTPLTGGIINFRGEVDKTDDVVDDLVDHFDALGKSLQTLNKHQERANRIQREMTAAAEGFKDAAKALGVTLEGEVNKEIEKNNGLIEQARDLAERGVRTWGDYERTVIQVGIANDKLKASLTGEVDVLEDRVLPALEQAAIRQRDFTLATGETVEVLKVQNAELARTAASANAIPGVSGGQGSSDFAQVGSGTFVTIEQLPGVTNDGRVVVPGVGRVIANPSFVRIV